MSIIFLRSSSSPQLLFSFKKSSRCCRGCSQRRATNALKSVVVPQLNEIARWWARQRGHEESARNCFKVLIIIIMTQSFHHHSIFDNIMAKWLCCANCANIHLAIDWLRLASALQSIPEISSSCVYAKMLTEKKKNHHQEESTKKHKHRQQQQQKKNP